MLTSIILAVCGLSLVALIIVVLYSNPKASVNRWLSAFMASGLLWLLANILANSFAYNPEVNLFFTRFALVGASILPLTFLMFCLAYTKKRTSTLLKILLTLPTLCLLAISPTSLNVIGVSSDGSSFETGVAYPILLSVLLLYFGTGILMLTRHYTKSDQQTRQQLNYILVGIILTLVPGIILSAILPLLGNSSTVSFGPAVVIAFSIFTSIAIIRHRLFDIRFFVIRALTYSLSTLLLALLYVAPIVWLLFEALSVDYTVTKFVLTVLGASLLATNYQGVRDLFNSLTSSLFFRDEYDPTQVIAALNKSLSSTIIIKDMIAASTKIVNESVKPEYCTFIIQGPSDARPRLMGDLPSKILKNEIVEVATKLDAIGHDLTITAELPESRGAKAFLQAIDISLVSRLSTQQGGKKSTLGYIVLGPRKNGTAYNPKDKQVLDAISNTLVIAIQNALHFEEIQNFNTTLQGRVDEATRKYRAANEKLKKLDETKDEFISMASHQLRTPLTSVKGYLSMVLEGDVGTLNKQQEELLKQSYLSSQRMVNLIADLLNLSRLNTGKFIIDPHPIDLRDVVDSELMQLRETAKAKDIKLAYKKPDSFPILNIDENKIHQVVMNFADNAIYYTPNGGKITVELRETPTAIEYTVTDTGIGVPREVQRHLFTKFYRADNAKRARPDGTGLGLFMAKKVIIAQGGSVIFDSEEGRGSTFGFRFNKSQLAVPDPKV